MNNSRQRTNERTKARANVERMWREAAAAALVRLLTYVITSLKICAERGQMNRELDLIKTNLSWLNKSYPISNINRKSVRVGVTGDECNNKNDWAQKDIIACAAQYTRRAQWWSTRTCCLQGNTGVALATPRVAGPKVVGGTPRKHK